MRASSGKTNSESRSVEAKRLLEIRNALLSLHKALVEFERTRYEKIVGTIQSPNQFLQLLTHDPWFAWLHPLSQLIVSMDEVLDEKEPLTTQTADTLVRQSGLLLAPAEHGQDFSGHYFESLQSDPDVVMAHASAIKLIGRAPKS